MIELNRLTPGQRVEFFRARATARDERYRGATPDDDHHKRLAAAMRYDDACEDAYSRILNGGLL